MQFKDKQLWLRSLYNKIFFGDIITRYAIRNDHALKLMVKKLAESTHDETSFNRVRHVIQSAGIKIGTTTLIEYVGYLAESFLIARVRNYLSKSIQKETAGKFYFTDNGILSLFLMNAETILLENIVANHLLRKHREGLFYLRKTHEVDFYLPDQSAFVQVSYAFPKPETELREIQAMLNLSKIVKADTMTVVTFDTEKVLETSGMSIRFVPVWKWLLEEV